MFVLSLTNGSMLTPIYQPGSKMMSVINGRYHGSRTPFWKCRLQVHTEALRGFLFLVTNILGLIQNVISQVFNTWEQVKKSFVRIIFPSSLIHLFIYFLSVKSGGRKFSEYHFQCLKSEKKMSAEGFYLFIYLVWNLVKTDVEDSLPPCVKLSGRKIHEISSWKTKWITFIQVLKKINL